MDAFRAAVLVDDGDAAYDAAIELARGVLAEPTTRLALQVLTGDRLAVDRGALLAEEFSAGATERVAGRTNSSA